MSTPVPTRDQLAALYFEQLPFEPYPVQQEALLAWFTSAQGVLVCAPTGTGKTLIAEAAVFEALHTGRQAYYTTPLIALTDQKFEELRRAAVQWGFRADDIGLVTGNRKVNADAPVLVVVAEILLNRLLHREAFSFDEVSAVVMDEFHNFNDPERGVVWEFSLAMLPPQVRTLLLSATVGNAVDFNLWLRRCHQRKLELVRDDKRKTPLTFQWVGDALLDEHLVAMAEGDDDARRTPALVFCFNREECWNTADLLRGRKLLRSGQQDELADELERHDWSQGAGPKLKQILMRGVGVHHAGVLPKYRRVVEELFQRKLLSVCVCTETLAAGVNLPARSVVLPSLMKGPPDKKKLIEPSSAHQMFGRAGRPQFDAQGFVYALAHEDDVKILRWKAKYDSIPETAKDPASLKAKKDLKRKMPTRRANEQYWTQSQFEKLCQAPPSHLASRGHVPWRLLAYFLDASPEIEPLRQLVGKRLLDPKQLQGAQKSLERMLRVLDRAGYVELEPRPPQQEGGDGGARERDLDEHLRAAEDLLDALDSRRGDDDDAGPPRPALTLGGARAQPGKLGASKDGGKPLAGGKPQGAGKSTATGKHAGGDAADPTGKAGPGSPPPPVYKPALAHPTERLAMLLKFRAVNPLYGMFLVNQLGLADRNERLQAMESVLELPGSVAHFVRVPRRDEMPPGPLALNRLDNQLLQLGLASAEELGAMGDGDDENQGPPPRRGAFDEPPPRVLTLADKLKLLFDFDFPGVHDARVTPVWSVGELFDFGGDFNRYVVAKKLQKQEGVLFRHFLRMILLAGEFAQLTPPDASEDEWRGDLREVVERLTAACRAVDPQSTDKILEEALEV